MLLNPLIEGQVITWKNAKYAAVHYLSTRPAKTKLVSIAPVVASVCIG